VDGFAVAVVERYRFDIIWRCWGRLWLQMRGPMYVEPETCGVMLSLRSTVFVRCKRNRPKKMAARWGCVTARESTGKRGGLVPISIFLYRSLSRKEIRSSRKMLLVLLTYRRLHRHRLADNSFSYP
jgi:hypothetical protein